MSFSRSNVLILGSNSLYSLLPSTLISQVEALLDAHLVENAVQMAEQQRKKLQSRLNVDDEEVSVQLCHETFPNFTVDSIH